MVIHQPECGCAGDWGTAAILATEAMQKLHIEAAIIYYKCQPRPVPNSAKLSRAYILLSSRNQKVES